MIYWLWLPPSQRITDPFWEIKFSHLSWVCMWRRSPETVWGETDFEEQQCVNLCGVTPVLSVVCPVDGPVIFYCSSHLSLSIVLHYLLVDKYSVWALSQYVFIPFQAFKTHGSPLSYHKHAGAPLRYKRFIEKKKKIIKTTLALIGGVRLVCWKLWCSRMSALWIDLAKNTHTPDQSEASICCGPAGHRGLQASKSSF